MNARTAAAPDLAAIRARWFVRAAILIAFIGLYVGGAWWGFSLANDDGISAWYPPVAFSLGLTALLGIRWAPAIALADLVQWALIGDQPTPGAAIVYAVILAIAFGGAGALLRRWLRGEPPLTRVTDLVVFLAVGSVAAPLIAALLIMLVFTAVTPVDWSDYVEQVRTLFIGDALAVISITPALLTIGAVVRGVALQPTSPRGAFSAEDAGMAIALVAFPVLAIVALTTHVLFICLFPLVWVALRRGISWATGAIAVWSVVSVVTFDLVELDVPLVDAQAFLLAGGTLALLCGSAVSERERGRSRFAYLALHDDITGLPNQHRLMSALTDALSRDDRGHAVAVLAVQLRGLRGVLTSVGREALDQLLTVIADRLRIVTGPDATLARLSPSRFVVLLDGPAAGRAEELGTRIVETLATPMRVDGRELALEASVGVAFGSGDTDPDTVLAHADAATATAARHTGSRAVVYDISLEQEVMRRREIERGLSRALEDEAFTLAFQPIVGIDGDGPVDAEALLRWTTPDGETIPPNTFIPIAEQTGLILRLGRWVLGEACHAAATWPEVRGRAVRVSVNVSPAQLQDTGFVDDVRAALSDAGLPPHRLRLEVTESIVVDDVDTAIARLTELRELGVEAMLDDFGTGYSSLSWVQRLPVTCLKVDGSFVAGLETGEVDRAIVRATIGLAHAIGIGVVAEGVETERQRDILRGLGCPTVQGYLTCRPIDGVAFGAWLAAQSE